MRRALRWMRLEDDRGLLSLSNVALFTGIGFLFDGRIAPFIAGACLCGISMLISYGQTIIAMEGANEIGLLKMQQEHEAAIREEPALAKEMKELQRKVHELATPERMDALSKWGKKAGA